MEQKRAGAGRQTHNERTGTTSVGSQFIGQEFGAPEDVVTDEFIAEPDDEDEECVECGGRLRNYDGGDRCVYCQDADARSDRTPDDRPSVQGRHNPAIFTPRRPELRGTCEQAAKSLAESDLTLTVIRGWYVDTAWGMQEHWWCARPDGQVVDPTVEQFPTGHIAALREYVPYEGVYPCAGCGIPVREERGCDGYCCGACYGSDVGIFVGRCEC